MQKDDRAERGSSCLIVSKGRELPCSSVIVTRQEELQKLFWITVQKKTHFYTSVSHEINAEGMHHHDIHTVSIVVARGART